MGKVSNYDDGFYFSEDGRIKCEFNAAVQLQGHKATPVFRAFARALIKNPEKLMQTIGLEPKYK